MRDKKDNGWKIYFRGNMRFSLYILIVIYFSLFVFMYSYGSATDCIYALTERDIFFALGLNFSLSFGVSAMYDEILGKFLDTNSTSAGCSFIRSVKNPFEKFKHAYFQYEKMWLIFSYLLISISFTVSYCPLKLYSQFITVRDLAAEFIFFGCLLGILKLVWILPSEFRRLIGLSIDALLSVFVVKYILYHQFPVYGYIIAGSIAVFLNILTEYIYLHVMKKRWYKISW